MASFVSVTNPLQVLKIVKFWTHDFFDFFKLGAVEVTVY